MKEKAKHILIDHHITVTAPRLAVLETFLQSDQALSYGQVMQTSKSRLTRVTVFRVLNLLTDRNIIHRIAAPDHTNHYFLRQDSMQAQAVFVCSKCSRIQRLEILQSPKMKLPASASVVSMEVVIRGDCGRCHES